MTRGSWVTRKARSNPLAPCYLDPFGLYTLHKFVFLYHGARNTYWDFSLADCGSVD